MNDSLNSSGAAYGYEIAAHQMPSDGTALPQSAIELAIARGYAHEVVRTRNKITEVGLSVISRLMGFAYNSPSVFNVGPVVSAPVLELTDLRVATMRFGDTAGVAAPASTDYQLAGNLLYASRILLVQYASSYNKVSWAGVLPADIGGGAVLAEEGLFTTLPAMVARTTFVHAVTPGKAFQYTHTLTFTAA